MRGNFFSELVVILLACILSAMTSPALANQESVSLPKVFLEGIPYDLTVSSAGAPQASSLGVPPKLIVNDRSYDAHERGGNWVFLGVVAQDANTVQLRLMVNNTLASDGSVPVIPGWVSILPPLLAIGMALLLRRVLPALMLGLWIGAWALEGMSL